MSVKLMVGVTLNSEKNIDFRFEIDDSEKVDPVEREVVEALAAACLLEVQRICEDTDGTVVEHVN